MCDLSSVYRAGILSGGTALVLVTLCLLGLSGRSPLGQAIRVTRRPRRN